MMPGSRSSDPDPVWIRIQPDSELYSRQVAATDGAVVEWRSNEFALVVEYINEQFQFAIVCHG